jgi:hypothetical protein
MGFKTVFHGKNSKSIRYNPEFGILRDFEIGIPFEKPLFQRYVTLHSQFKLSLKTIEKILRIIFPKNFILMEI